LGYTIISVLWQRPSETLTRLADDGIGVTPASRMMGAMRRAARAFLVGFLVFVPWVWRPIALAQASETSRAAAAQFDTGVQAYKQADYVRAAEAFLAADTALPSVNALSNALAAARRTGLSLLMARAAERSLARPGVSDADRKSAESILREVSAQLARLEIRCEAGPCVIEIDGVRADINGSYVLPGEHRIAAEGALPELLSCAASQVYKVTLRPLPVVPAPALAAKAPPSAALAAVSPRAATRDQDARLASRRKQRLPLALLVSSGAGALVLLSLATWQGVEALDQKKAYKSGDDWSEVIKPAHRSDYLLAGGLALTATALATAIWWVDWHAYGRAQLALLPAGGAMLTARRRF
jgi:hypothetical protein